MSPGALALSCAGVIAFFLASAVLLPVILFRSSLTRRERKVFLAICLLSIAAKMALATLGHNFDVDSWKLVTGYLEQGKSVYSATYRWPYGPALFPAFAGLDRIVHFLYPSSGDAIHMVGPNTGEALHVALAAFLATIDVLIALTLALAYSYSAAVFFLLCPIVLIISGFHSQVDNVAVLAALLAWLLIRKGQPNTSRWLKSAVLLGLSLTIKHILIFFPIWLLFWKPLGAMRTRLTYLAIAYGLFFLSFLPWLVDPASRAGIVQHVAGYKSFYGNSLLGIVTQWFIGIQSIDAFFAWLPGVDAFKTLWMGFLVILGIIAARRSQISELFLVYLMILYSLSMAIADQYLAIPMIAAAVYCRLSPSWAFMVSGVIALCLSPVELFSPDFGEVTLGGHRIRMADLGYGCALVGSQVCMLGLLVVVWRNRMVIEERWSRQARVMRAAVLFAAGCVPVLIPFASRALQMIRNQSP
jgi:hypothetical protein